MQEEEVEQERDAIPSVRSGGGAPPFEPPAPPSFSGGTSGRPGASEHLSAREVDTILNCLRHFEADDQPTIRAARQKLQRASGDGERGVTLLP